MCSGKLEIKLQVVGKDASIDHRAINLCNNAIYINNRTVTNEDICLHLQAISSRGTLRDIAASIQDC